MTLARRKTPTKAQQSYQDAARALGCVVCRFRGHVQGGTTEIHHRNSGDHHGQKQVGQDAVVALCSYHHRGLPIHGWSMARMREFFGPSFALHARDFRVWTQDVLPGYGLGTEAWQQKQDEYLEEQ
jgi:hypothetical protein